MKKLFVIAISLIFSQAIWAQKFIVPTIPGEIEKSEYANYAQDFISCVDWLESHSTTATQRKEVNSYTLWWMAGSPDVNIKVTPDLADFNNGDLLILYMGSWSRHIINNPKASNVDGCMAGTETIINYYLKHKDSLGKNKCIENLVKLEKKGSLRQFVENSLSK